jgi:HTH-type transcriptional regulator/antitoxin HigA
MATKIKRDYMQTYEKLVRLFPLRPIRTEDENDQAATVCDLLTDRLDDLSQAESDYLEVLTDLVGKFESRWKDVSDMDPRALVEYLMEQNNLSQSDLVPEFGSASRVSEFLSGKRGLSLEQVRRLSSRFKLNPSALLEQTT